MTSYHVILIILRKCKWLHQKKKEPDGRFYILYLCVLGHGVLNRLHALCVREGRKRRYLSLHGYHPELPVAEVVIVKGL